MLLKWYNEHGFKMGELIMPKLISASAIMKTARRKSKGGFSCLVERRMTAWYVRGRKKKFKTWRQSA